MQTADYLFMAPLKHLHFTKELHLFCYNHMGTFVLLCKPLLTCMSQQEEFLICMHVPQHPALYSSSVQPLSTTVGHNLDINGLNVLPKGTLEVDVEVKRRPSSLRFTMLIAELGFWDATHLRVESVV